MNFLNKALTSDREINDGKSKVYRPHLTIIKLELKHFYILSNCFTDCVKIPVKGRRYLDV